MNTLWENTAVTEKYLVRVHDLADGELRATEEQINDFGNFLMEAIRANAPDFEKPMEKYGAPDCTRGRLD